MEKIKAPSLRETLKITPEMWNDSKFAEILKMPANEFESLSQEYIDSNTLRHKAWLFRCATLGARDYQESKRESKYERLCKQRDDYNKSEDRNDFFCEKCRRRGYIAFVDVKGENCYLKMRKCECNHPR